jgi:hypothetical protein
MKRRPKGMGCVAFLRYRSQEAVYGHFKEKMYWNIQK